MKVALAHDHLFQLGGAERVVAEFHRLFPDAPLYTLVYSLLDDNWFANMDIRTSILQRIPGAKNHLKYFLSLMPIVWEQFDFSDYDIVLSSTSALAKGLITPPHALHISYCHTPTRYLWSDAHSYVEELNQPRLIKKILPLILHRLRMWDLFAAQRVDRFIANSDFVARRIRKYYNRPAQVIYPPVPTEQYRISPTIGDYYIIISRLRPYKKVDLAIRAFNELGLPLLVIGDGEESARLRQLAKSNIRFLGAISEADKIKYLQKAIAFIHPQVEDFGIAAVEAMAAGRPVIAFAGGGALETVVEGVSGTFFQEQSWECLTHKILQFDSRDYDPQLIRASALKYSPERFRQEINDFIAQAWQDFNQVNKI
ncbi:MAG: glycosyltransferase [Candidatus Komeilibacteria bacterium]